VIIFAKYDHKALTHLRQSFKGSGDAIKIFEDMAEELRALELFLERNKSTFESISNEDQSNLLTAKLRHCEAEIKTLKQKLEGLERKSGSKTDWWRIILRPRKGFSRKRERTRTGKTFESTCQCLISLSRWHALVAKMKAAKWTKSLGG
jgi:hypothetical protein